MTCITFESSIRMAQGTEHGITALVRMKWTRQDDVNGQSSNIWIFYHMMGIVEWALPCFIPCPILYTY